MLKYLEADIKRMLYLAEKIASYNERILWITNLEDKRNLNLKHADKMEDRVSELHLELEELKNKYFTKRF